MVDPEGGSWGAAPPPPLASRSDIEILATTGLHIVTQTAGLCLLLLTFFVRVTASEGGGGGGGGCSRAFPIKIPKAIPVFINPSSVLKQR